MEKTENLKWIKYDVRILTKWKFLVERFPFKRDLEWVFAFVLPVTIFWGLFIMGSELSQNNDTGFFCRFSKVQLYDSYICCGSYSYTLLHYSLEPVRTIARDEVSQNEINLILTHFFSNFLFSCYTYCTPYIYYCKYLTCKRSTRCILFCEIRLPI